MDAVGLLGIGGGGAPGIARSERDPVGRCRSRLAVPAGIWVAHWFRAFVMVAVPSVPRPANVGAQAGLALAR